MRIGVLTGGGDCPGLNAVIRAIVRKGINAHGHEFVGFRYGWAGVLKNETMDAHAGRTRGILHRGGTILGSSRTNPYKVEGGVEKVKAAMKARGLDALIPIGGEDTLGVAGKLHEDGINVVGVPEDDRQRPRRDGLHVRLPDRGADRDRRDRPAAHHGRVAQPRDHRRGHGPPRGLDRALLRHRRRRRRGPDPGAAVRRRRGLRAHPPPPRSGGRSRSSSSPRARRAPTAT